MWGFRGALLTWAAAIGAIVLFGVMTMVLLVGSSYHPMSSGAYQMPFLLALMALTLVALWVLAICHATKARRTEVKRNLAELGAIVLGFALIFGLIMIVVTGPKTLDRVMFGQTYQVPTVYRPTVLSDDAGQGKSLVIGICTPDDTPTYAASGHCNQAQVIFGKAVLTDDFDVGYTLENAGASHTGDILHNLGTHRSGDEPGEIVYGNPRDELRLWLVDGQKVEMARHCDLRSGVNCTAHVRMGEWTVVFPVHDPQVTASKAALQQAAQAWLDRLESWRCKTPHDCPLTSD